MLSRLLSSPSFPSSSRLAMRLLQYHIHVLAGVIVKPPRFVAHALGGYTVKNGILSDPINHHIYTCRRRASSEFEANPVSCLYCVERVCRGQLELHADVRSR